MIGMKSVNTVYNKHLIHSIFIRLFVVLSGVIISILTARLLGPAGRGAYFFFAKLFIHLLARRCRGRFGFKFDLFI
jgi:hypothetical protein